MVRAAEAGFVAGVVAGAVTGSVDSIGAGMAAGRAAARTRCSGWRAAAFFTTTEVEEAEALVPAKPLIRALRRGYSRGEVGPSPNSARGFNR